MKRVQRKRSKTFMTAIILAGVLVIGVGALIGWQSIKPVKEAPATVQTPPAPQPVGVSSNTLFFGNVFWGRYINDWSMASPLKTAYPFSRLSEFDRGKYDAWIAGLECPTAAGVHLTSAEEDNTLSFNCSPDYLPEAAKWFTAFTLANNHTDNQGPEAFTETKQHLDQNGIQYFGHYDPRTIDEICEVIALPVSVKYDNGSTKKEAMPVALCGFHGVFRIPPEESLAVMEEYSKYMPVIAMPHMGAEYVSTPDEIKTTTYRSMIDHGADMVIGDHPHWIQTTESYKGKLIVYSMGNFIFDQQDQAERVRSAGINVLMSVKDATPAELKSWLAIGATCKTFHDDCLQQIEKKNLAKLSYTFQFGVVGTNDFDKIVKPATPEQQASILERLQWTKTMSQLQAPQSSL